MYVCVLRVIYVMNQEDLKALWAHGLAYVKIFRKNKTGEVISSLGYVRFDFAILLCRLYQSERLIDAWWLEREDGVTIAQWECKE